MRVYEALPGQVYFAQRTQGMPLWQKFDLLARYNIGTVVNLWWDPDPDLANYNGIVYFHQSMPDGKTWEREELERLAVQVTARIVATKRAALVQCYGGRNRSGLLAALIVRELTGCSGAEAYQRIRDTRAGALGNEAFATYLGSLA
jgi:protein-tyrosine phosphatase